MGKWKANRVVEKRIKEFGSVKLLLGQAMDAKGVTISKMAKLSGVDFNVVKRYYKDEVSQAHYVTLAKFCFVLQCDITDIMVYKCP